MNKTVAFDRLAAWYLAWSPPAEPYAVWPWLRVVDPARSHAYHAERLREGVRGQVQRAALVWLQRHAELFGGPT